MQESYQKVNKMFLDRKQEQTELWLAPPGGQGSV